MTATSPPKRQRNAAATRTAILRSALTAFSRAGYDAVGLREIAQEAGITPVLINRYFGTKEELFAEVVEALFSSDSLFGDSAADLAQQFAEMMIEKTRRNEAAPDPLFLMLRSTPNSRAADILRSGIERHFERPLAARLSGNDSLLRASMFLAVVAGFQFMRGIIGSTALTSSTDAEVARRLASIFRMIIDDGMCGTVMPSDGAEPVGSSTAMAKETGLTEGATPTGRRPRAP